MITARSAVRAAQGRQYRGIIDHNTVGVNSLRLPAADRKMLRKAQREKDIVLFHNPVPFRTHAAYIRRIRGQFYTRT
jgi:hypothetical protein